MHLKSIYIKNKVKGLVHPRTGHADPEGVKIWLYSFFNLYIRQDWIVNLHISSPPPPLPPRWTRWAGAYRRKQCVIICQLTTSALCWTWISDGCYICECNKIHNHDVMFCVTISLWTPQMWPVKLMPQFKLIYDLLHNWKQTGIVNVTK